MTTRSHQTVRLSPGRHPSPEQGACVMELASMIAGERFSDHPESVSPVLAAVLRWYNDAAGDDRQDLLRCAAEAVGTTLDARAERRRVDLCLAAVDDMLDLGSSSRLERWASRAATRRIQQLAADAALDADSRERFAHGVVVMLRRGREPGHERAMRLVDELVAVGRVATRAAVAAPAVAQRAPRPASTRSATTSRRSSMRRAT